MIRRFLSNFRRNTKSVATMIETWKDGKPTYSETSFEGLTKSGWRKNELIYACITLKADTAAQVGLDVIDSSGAPVDNHPLKQLIQRPNPFMTEFDLWYAVITYIHLAGKAVFEKERARSGQIVALWPLRPDWLHPIPSSVTFIGGYEYEVPGVGKRFLSPKDVLEFKLFDPINMYNPWPPVAVAARIGDVDNQATDYIKLFFEKGASPPAYLKTTQKLTDPQADELRERWMKRYGGSDKWIEPAVLDRDADYIRAGLTFNEMGFGELDARNEARICAILKVPPIIVNAKVGLDRSTYSNYAEARRAWWEDTLIPMYMSFQDTIENGLANEYGDVDVKWNFSKVIALREDEQMRWERANNALQLGGITVNEYRAQLGLRDVGKAGDVFLRGLNVVATGVPSANTTPPAKSIELKSDLPHDNQVREALENSFRDSIKGYFVDLGQRLKEEVEKNA